MNKQLEDMRDDIYMKLEELRKACIEQNETVHVSLRNSSYWVLLEDHHDEETREYLKEEMGVEVGDWVSSSDMC